MAFRRTRGVLTASAASVALLVLFLLRNHAVPSLGVDHSHEFFMGPRLLIEAAAMLLVVRRVELPTGTRRTMFLLGVISSVSSIVAMAPGISAWTGLPVMSEPLRFAWIMASFPLAAMAILWLPMEPFRRGEWWTFLLDAVVSVGGYATIIWYTQTAPVLAIHPWPEAARYTLYSLVCGAMVLLILTQLALRRRANPSSRAFWLFVGGMSAYLPTTILARYAAESFAFSTISDAGYFLGPILTVWASWAMQFDPVRVPARESQAHWFRSFNPFALVMPAVTGAVLLIVLREGPAEAARPLAVSGAAISVLLALRLALTIRENTRSIRAAAERDRVEQETRLEALRRVAGGVAHEFNNSLTTVLGYADLGVRSDTTPDARLAFGQIRASAERSAAITRHLLWFTGHQRQERERLALCEWLRAFRAEMRRRAPDSIRILVECGDADASLDADPGQLHDALMELVNNSVTAMPDGGTLTLRAGIVPPNAGEGAAGIVQISVIDTGNGIPKESLPHVFEPFWSSQHMAVARGLGLALALGVAHAHGGTLTAISEQGQGTEMRLRLPLE